MFRLALNAFVIFPLLFSGTAMADEQPRPPFRFVQLCDPQLGFGANGYEADLKSLRQAIQQINELKPDFVIVCGDLVNSASKQTLSEFKAAIAKCQVPCHCAAGNHDIGSPVNPSRLAEFREIIGKDHMTFEHRGCTFVVVNTQLWKASVQEETERHDSWLEGVLHQAKERNSPVFVIGHYPLFLKSADEEEEYFNIPLPQRTKILDLFRTCGVVAMLSGHTHRLTSNTYHGILFFGGETTSKNFDQRSLGFRLWTVEFPIHISHQFIALDAP